MRERYTFQMVECVKNGLVLGRRFERGEIYPILGENNGVQVGYDNNGDANVITCHNYGDTLIPVFLEKPFIEIDPCDERLPHFVSFYAWKGVRCGECEHFYETKHGNGCMLDHDEGMNSLPTDWFCADGERKGEEG